MDWLILFVLLAVLFYKFRRQAHFKFPILYFQTKRLVDDVWRTGKRHRRLISTAGDVGVLIALFLLPLTFFFVAKSAFDVATVEGMKSPIAPVVPGVKLPGTDVFIPLWHGVVAMAILGSVHELSHGLMASAQGTKPKSIVILFLAILTSFGVELDEKEVSALSLRKQLRIFAAGSFANFLTALLFFVALLLFSRAAQPFLQPTGMRIVEVGAGTPAEGVLEVGEVVVSMNGTPAHNLSSFLQVSQTMLPNQTMSVETRERRVFLETAPHPEQEGRGRIGIITSMEFEAPRVVVSPLIWLGQLFHWLIGLNIGVGFLNLLPLPPFDGGRMAAAISEKYLEGSRFPQLLYTLTFALLMVNIFGGLIKGL